MARHHSRSLSPERKRTSEGRQRRYGEDSENYRRKYHKSDRESGRARLGESRRERSRERSLKDQSRHHSSRRSERDDYDSERHKEKRARKDMGSLTIVPNPIISPNSKPYVPTSLAPHLLKNAPPSIYYIPSFVSPPEADKLMNAVKDLTIYVDLNSSVTPQSVHHLADRLARMGVYNMKEGEKRKPTSWHARQYAPDAGVIPHQDGPLYHPSVAILSLNETTIIHLSKTTNPETDPTTISLLLEPGSFYILRDEAYTEWYHGIRFDKILRGDVKRIVNLGMTGFAGRDDVIVEKRKVRFSVGFRAERY